jgi:hypothetical protein
VVLLKVCRNEFTGELSLGLSVEALHTAIDHAKVVIAELDPSMPFTQGQSVVDAQSIDYLIEKGVKPVYDFTAPDFPSSKMVLRFRWASVKFRMPSLALSGMRNPKISVCKPNYTAMGSCF